MALYRHILLALDLSAEDQRLLQRAADLCTLCGARLSLLHVITQPSLGYVSEFPVSEEIGLRQDLQEQAEVELAQRAGQLDGVQVDWHVASGSVRHEIERLAEGLGVDLIMLGSHGRHGLRLLLGSTTDGVLHLACCDVLAVRHA
ncbi:MAG: universal stress protein [Gammaproteobacteria bacterium SHHR-1]